MTTLSLSARLDRTDSSTPWGFRMHGGKDFGCPLSIQKVNPNSLAQQCGLQTGDAIVKIGDSPTDGMMHREAQQTIVSCGNHLELALQRGGGRPSATSHVQAPSYPTPAPPQNNYAPQPPQNSFAASAPSSTLPVAVNKQYNTPINMYSVNNVMDTLAHQTSGVNIGPSGSEEADKMHETDDSKEIGNFLHVQNPSLAPTASDKKAIYRNASPVPFSTKIMQPARGVSPINFKVGDPKPAINAPKPAFSSVQPALTKSSPPPPLPESAPPLPESAPPTSSMAPPTSNVAPPIPNVSPPTSNVALPTSYVAPPTSNVAPPTSYVAPPPSNVAPPPALPTSAPPSAVSAALNEEKEVKYKAHSNPNIQSRSFKALQQMIDSGEEMPTMNMGRKISAAKPAAAQPAPPQNDKYVKAIVNKQYNTPIGLYSGTNVKDSFETQATSLIDAYAGPQGDTVEQAERKTIKVPSATLAAIQAEESSTPQSAVRGGTFEKDVIAAGSERKQIVVPSAKFEAINSEKDDKVKYTPSETFRLVQQLDKGEEEAAPNPIPSKTFARLQKNLDSGGSAPPSHVPQTVGVSVGGSAAGKWQPSIPTGPRNMKVGKRGEARNMPAAGGGTRVPMCATCNISIRGPFVSALDKTWCPNHFVCANPQCRQPLIDVGFVEEAGQLFCENDYRMYFAPHCGKCGDAIIGERVSTQIGHYHAQCFVCSHCGGAISEGRYHTQDNKIYCLKDWGQLFQTKCYGCEFPIEPGDRWVEALNENWHSECFNCSTCQQNLEGQSFYAKSGKPFCKKHAGRI